MVLAAVRRGRAYFVQRQYDVEPALRIGIEKADRVGDRRAALAGVGPRPSDGGDVAVERVEGDHTGLRHSERVPDPQDRVHRFQHVAVAYAQTLVRRLDGELV